MTTEVLTPLVSDKPTRPTPDRVAAATRPTTPRETPATHPESGGLTRPADTETTHPEAPREAPAIRPVHTPRVGRRAARRTDPVEAAATRAARLHRDRVADALTAVVAGTAAFSSWTGWVLLGHHAGWPVLTLPGGHPFDTAWLNPVSVDVMAYVALRAWVSPRSSERTRLWGRRAAVGALALSIVGNALGHGLEASGLGRLLLSLGLAGMAPVLLFVVLHLRTLRTDDQRAAVEAARREAQERLEREAAREARRIEREATRAGGPTRQPARPQEAAREGASTRTGGQPPARREAQESSPAVAREGNATEPTREASTTVLTNPRPGDDELVAGIRALDEERGRRVGVDLIRRHFGIGASRATRLRELADKAATA